MSEDLKVNILRGSTTIIKNIPVQLDKVNVLEASAYQGADPHFTFRTYTTFLPLGDPQFIRFRDHMQDQVFIDYSTNTFRKYLIISDPELHTLDGHWQWICTRVRGT